MDDPIRPYVSAQAWWQLCCVRRGMPDMTNDARITQVLQAIDDRLEERSRVRDLAALVRLSPSRFAHLFRQAVGTSPRRFLAERRLLRARHLLLETSPSVKEVMQRMDGSIQATSLRSSVAGSVQARGAIAATASHGRSAMNQQNPPPTVNAQQTSPSRRTSSVRCESDRCVRLADNAVQRFRTERYRQSLPADPKSAPARVHDVVGGNAPVKKRPPAPAPTRCPSCAVVSPEGAHADTAACIRALETQVRQLREQLEPLKKTSSGE